MNVNHRRNLIIVLAHGLRSDAISDSDAWPLHTPFLHRMTKHGLRVTATSACPSDNGGVVSLLTGLHARQHGHLEPMSSPITCEGWPAQLAEQGYHLAGVGSVGPIEPWLNQSVFIDDVSEIDSPRCAYMQDLRDKQLLPAIEHQRRQRLRSGPFDPDRVILDPDEDIDGYIAMRGQAMLAEMPTDRPWCLIVAFSGPGNDLPPPPMYERVVEPASVESSFTPVDFRKIDAMAELDYPRVLLQGLEPHRLARIRADYLNRVSLFDHGVGRITTAIKSRADRDRTWTVVASDRGQLLGEHGLVGHRSFLRGAIDTPVLVLPPANKPVGKIDTGTGLFSTIDVAATIADLGGCDMAHAVQGRSLLDIIREAEVPKQFRSPVVSEFGKRLMLETERYTVVFDMQTRQPISLYDMLNDPDEDRNLVDTDQGRNMLDSLRWRLGDALMTLRAAAW